MVLTTNYIYYEVRFFCSRAEIEMYLQGPLSCFSRQKYLQSFKLFLTISVSSIVVGVLIFTTNHMKLDEITMVSNNFGKLQVPVSKISWACWLSASAAPTAAMTVLFLGLNIVFFWQHSANDFRWKIYTYLCKYVCLMRQSFSEETNRRKSW